LLRLSASIAGDETACHRRGATMVPTIVKSRDGASIFFRSDAHGIAGAAEICQLLFDTGLIRVGHIGL